MANRRGNNEGAIFKRKHGRWTAQVSIEGKRIAKILQGYGLENSERVELVETVIYSESQ